MKTREEIRLEAEVEKLRAQLVAMDQALCTEAPHRELEVAMRELLVILVEATDHRDFQNAGSDKLWRFEHAASRILSMPGLRPYLRDRCAGQHHRRRCVLKAGHVDPHLDAFGFWTKSPPKKKPELVPGREAERETSNR